MFAECYKILELFAVANLSNWWEMNRVLSYKTSVLIIVRLIVIAECAEDCVLLNGNRHDMTFSYSYDVNSAVEASD
jgi:hypothetical protein